MTFRDMMNRADDPEFERSVAASLYRTAIQIRNGATENTNEYRARQTFAINVLSGNVSTRLMARIVSVNIGDAVTDELINTTLASIWTACTTYIYYPEIIDGDTE